MFFFLDVRAVQSAILRWVYNENKKVGWRRVPRAVIFWHFHQSTVCTKIEIVNCPVLLAVQVLSSWEEETFKRLTWHICIYCLWGQKFRSHISDRYQEVIEDRKGRKRKKIGKGSYWFPKEERRKDMLAEVSEHAEKSKRAFSLLKGSST